MKNISPSPRKPDVLDSWIGLCYERSLAHHGNNKEKIDFLNEQLMETRRKGGWSDNEIREEFEIYNEALQQPYAPPIGNTRILYDLNDHKGNPLGLRLTLHQISLYWKHRNGGLEHDDAIKLII